MRADALGCRLNIHRQMHRRDQVREKSNTTIHQVHGTLANTRHSYHFGLDWHEPDRALDIVLVATEPPPSVVPLPGS